MSQCEWCEESESSIECHDCEKAGSIKLCSDCSEFIHRKGKGAKHRLEPLHLQFNRIAEPKCERCEELESSVECHDCEKAGSIQLCSDCSEIIHRKGKGAKHRLEPLHLQEKGTCAKRNQEEVEEDQGGEVLNEKNPLTYQAVTENKQNIPEEPSDQHEDTRDEHHSSPSTNHTVGTSALKTHATTSKTSINSEQGKPAGDCSSDFVTTKSVLGIPTLKSQKVQNVISVLVYDCNKNLTPSHCDPGDKSDHLCLTPSASVDNGSASCSDLASCSTGQVAHERSRSIVSTTVSCSKNSTNYLSILRTNTDEGVSYNASQQVSKIFGSSELGYTCSQNRNDMAKENLETLITCRRKRTLDNADLKQVVPQKKQKFVGLMPPDTNQTYRKEHHKHNKRTASLAEKYNDPLNHVMVSVPAKCKIPGKDRAVTKYQNLVLDCTTKAPDDFDLRKPCASKAWQSQLSLVLDKLLKEIRATSKNKGKHTHNSKGKSTLTKNERDCVVNPTKVNCESNVKGTDVHMTQGKKQKDSDTPFSGNTDCSKAGKYVSRQKTTGTMNTQSNLEEDVRNKTRTHEKSFPSQYAAVDTQETEEGRKMVEYSDDIFSISSDSITQPWSLLQTKQLGLPNKVGSTVPLSQKFPLGDIKVEELGKACKDGPCLYRCDFCKHVEPNISKIHDHLISCKHYSASLCTVRVACDTFEILHTEKCLACKIEENQGIAYEVVCPLCQEVFPDIYVCGLHSKLTHGTVKEIYSVCPVLNKSTEIIKPERECVTCSLTLPSRSAAKKHIKANPSHNIKTQKEKISTPVIRHDCIAVYQCPYCNVRFDHHGFHSAKAHILQHVQHKKSLKNANVAAVTVRLVKKPSCHEVLPPACLHKQPNNLWLEIETLERQAYFLKNSCFGCGFGKKRKAITKGIQKLKKLAGPCAQYGRKQTGLFHWVKPNGRS